MEEINNRFEIEIWEIFCVINQWRVITSGRVIVLKK